MNESLFWLSGSYDKPEYNFYPNALTSNAMCNATMPHGSARGKRVVELKLVTWNWIWPDGIGCAQMEVKMVKWNGKWLNDIAFVQMDCHMAE